mgnify:CR=1 FL=1
MSKAFISLGANEGKRLENIQEAVTRIQNKIGNVIALSSIYQTPSMGFDGPDFLNACIEIDTGLNPLDVLDKLLDIERAMGREPSPEKGYQSRPIDLDLLFYEEQIINTQDLILPHPRCHLRNFVLLPILQIDPNWSHPILKKNAQYLINNLNQKSRSGGIRETIQNKNESKIQIERYLEVACLVQENVLSMHPAYLIWICGHYGRKFWERHGQPATSFDEDDAAFVRKLFEAACDVGNPKDLKPAVDLRLSRTDGIAVSTNAVKHIDRENKLVKLSTQPEGGTESLNCLLYTSPSPRDKRQSRMPSSA